MKKLSQHAKLCISLNGHLRLVPKPIAAFPLDVLEEIFLHIPAHQLVCVCRLVSHGWRQVADSQTLWKRRCRREGYQPPEASKIPADWRMYYFMCKQRRNLLKNPRGDEQLEHWNILQNGGDGWARHNAIVRHPNPMVKHDFVTSYHMCIKSQLIDLRKEGYNAAFMDQFQPDIKISDWFARRSDCGAVYKICVELLNHKKEPIQTFAPDIVNVESHVKWNQMTHVFKNYGPGVRYIDFKHGGKDTRYWKGWYGSRVTDSSVEICPSVDQ